MEQRPIGQPGRGVVAARKGCCHGLGEVALVHIGMGCSGCAQAMGSGAAEEDIIIGRAELQGGVRATVSRRRSSISRTGMTEKKMMSMIVVVISGGER